jgi:hypothetical protein
MSFVLGRSERQGISTPFQFGQHRKKKPDIVSIFPDGQDSVEFLNASQMFQSQARDVPLIKNANGVAARVAKARSESRLRVIASRVRKSKTVPDARYMMPRHPILAV